MMISFKTILICAVSSAILAGCSDKQPPEAKASSENSQIAIPTDQVEGADNGQSTLLAAAEPFEALTEQAATAKPSARNRLIGDARNAATAIAGSLDHSQQSKLTSHLDEIDRAQKAGDPTGIALAAVEGYRTIIESAPDTALVPRAVSLLDYAGFRYQANLTAKPARWSDATAAVNFAEMQWSLVRPKVTDAALRDQMEKSIATMRKAIEAKDAILAKSSSTTELDLVDKLEEYFAAAK